MVAEHEKQLLVEQIASHQALIEYVARRLETNPAGFTEYELMEACRDEGWLAFDSLSYERKLFCSHFLLFNALYQLRERYWLLEQGILEISALRIVLRPAMPARAVLGPTDKLSEYYLNLEHYFGTDAAEVRRLMTSFWQAFAGLDARREALAVLGLQDPVSNEHVRHTYRRLAMQHHPDRGGEGSEFQRIQAAAAVLLRSRI